MEKAYQGKLSVWMIAAVSVLVPVLVAILFFTPAKLSLGGFVYALPHLHAGINSATTLVLVAALIAIKSGSIDWHKSLMISAVAMGALFLISYVLYHSSVDSVIYGDLDKDGILSATERASAEGRGTYLVILVSHIVLSMFALPLVLIAFFLALKGNYARHKKIVRWAYPVWLYVSITGVVVYWMVRPYYL